MPAHTKPRRGVTPGAAGAAFLALLLLLGVTILMSHPAHTAGESQLLTTIGWWLVMFPVVLIAGPAMTAGRARRKARETYRQRHEDALGAGTGDKRHHAFVPVHMRSWPHS